MKHTNTFLCMHFSILKTKEMCQKMSVLLTDNSTHLVSILKNIKQNLP
jgi:hypothetical protein